MEITASSVMELRAKTGVSMMACKKALTEANGDEEKAIDILRKSGEAKAMSKADRETCQGLVSSTISPDKKKGILVKLLCETDFVAQNEDFKKLRYDFLNISMDEGIEAAQAKSPEMIKELILKIGENIQLGDVSEITGDYVATYIHTNEKIGAVVAFSGIPSEEIAKDVAMQIVACKPLAISPDQVDTTLVDSEKEVAKAQLENEGKPADMIDKILVGKMNKFKEENALMTQQFVKDPTKKVKDIIPNGVAVTGFKVFSI